MIKSSYLWWRLLLVLLLAVVGFGCSPKVEKHQQMAAKFFAAQQYDWAEIEYLNVLRKDSKNREAYGRLGLIYFMEGRFRRAAFFLANGSQMDTNNLELRLKLGFIYSAAGQYDEARDVANYVLDRKPEDDDAPMLLAETAVQPEEIAATRQRIQNLASHGNRAAYEVALANLAFRERNLTAAGEAAKRALVLDAKSTVANTALASWYWAQKDLVSAEKYFKTAAELAPIRSPQRMQYARFKLQTGDPTGGRQMLEEIVKQAADYVPAMLALAQVSATEKKFDEATNWLAKVMMQDTDNYEAMLFGSQLKLAQGQSAQAALNLEKMAKIYPRSPLVQYQLAVAYFAQEEFNKSLNSAARAVALNTNFTEAVLLMAQLQIKSQNPSPAIAVLEAQLRKQPQQVQAQLLLADAYRMQGRVSDALALYEPLEKVLPQNPQIPMFIGSSYLQLNNTGAARKAFTRVLALSPDNQPALEQLVNLDLAEKQFAAARARIQSADKKFKPVEMQLLLAKVSLMETNYGQAEAALLKAIELAPEKPGARLLLAQLYHDTGKNPQALAQLDAALAKDSRSISALMLMAVVYNEQKDYTNTAAVYEKLLLINPEFSPALNNLAYLYSEFLNRLDRAYDLAQHARELLPYDPSAADTLGWISFKRGTYSTALNLLRESATKLPAEPEVQFHLGMASYMTGDEASAQSAFQAALQTGKTFSASDECQRYLTILAINPATADAAARTLLEKRISEKADDMAALIRLAAIYQREGNSPKAIAACEAILKVNPKNLDILVSLTRLYSPTNISRAYETAKSAYKIAPDNSEVCHLYGNLASQSGDYRLAANLLQQVALNQPADAPVLFDFAQAAVRVGNLSDAKTALQSALSLNLPEPMSADAKQMVEWINLAADPSQAVIAGPRVSESLKSKPDDVLALLVAAVIGTVQGEVTAAAGICEKILARYPDFVPAQRQLVLLYASDPDKAKADRLFAFANKARSLYIDDPILTKAFGIMLIQRGDLGRAVNQLKASAEVLTNDAEVFFYLGTAQYRLKRPESKASLQQALTLKPSGDQATAASKMLEELK